MSADIIQFNLNVNLIDDRNAYIDLRVDKTLYCDKMLNSVLNNEQISPRQLIIEQKHETAVEL